MIAQVFAIIIFIAMFAFIIIDKWERSIVTTVCAVLALILVFGIGLHDGGAALETLNFKSVGSLSFLISTGESSSSSGVNWETIVFIAGMMIMVEGMAETGFFRWLCMKLAKMVKYRVMSLFVVFMILSAVLSMFIDSITVILFLAAITIELAELLEFSPVPMILTEVFCANLGGSATMCGNPPNIIIGTSLGFSFADFLLNTGLLVGVSAVAVILYFYATHKKELSKIVITDEMTSKFPDPVTCIENKGAFRASVVIFVIAVVLLVTHSMTGLTVATIGIGIAIVTLIVSGKKALSLLKRIDCRTLIFFIGLFVVVGGLEQTGILTILANFIGTASGGNQYAMIAIIVIVSAVASAFIDNIPFAATMIPVITSLAATEHIALPVLAWALVMGANIGGNATPIGASANVVGVATASKKGYIIKWGEYCKTAVPAVAIVLVISIVIIFVRYL